jgi:hypothetical protein
LFVADSLSPQKINVQVRRRTMIGSRKLVKCETSVVVNISALARASTRRTTLAALFGGALALIGRNRANATPPVALSPPREVPAPASPSAAQQAPAIHVSRLVTRLSRYGFKGNGSALDTQVWRDAIAEATDRNINEIIVPNGKSIVDGDLLSEVQGRLPAGLTFRGEGRNQDTEYVSNNGLIYVGKGTCWDIKYNTGGPLNTGRWIWEDLSFRSSDPAGTMFSFNDPLTSEPSDTDPFQFLMRIAFRHCFASGANATKGDFKTQTGDFIRASKVFHMTIDSLTTITGWRRAIWLKGCDNCQIDARISNNVRGIVNEMANGMFANETRIAPYSIAGLHNERGSSEPSYLIWDDGRDTTIGGSLLFEGRGAVAHMYLDGHRTKIEKPVFGASARMFHLGPNAREISMFSPDAPIPDPKWAPLIEIPTSEAFGGTQTDHRMRIHDAPLNTQLVLLAAKDRYGRIQVVNSLVHGRGYPAADETGIPTNSGYLVPIACTAANYWGEGGIGGRPIDGIVPDKGATGGQAIKLGAKYGSGFSLNFQIGLRVMPAKYELTIRNRLSGELRNGAFQFIATRNGKFFTHLTFAASTTYSRPLPSQLDLTAFDVGDMLAVELYNNGSGLNAWVDYIVLTPMSEQGSR